MSSVVTASLPFDKPARSEPEWHLQKQVCDFLKWSLPDNAVYFAVPNGGLRHSRAAAKLVATGVRAGIPDLCVIYAGRPIFFEFKSIRGVLSEHQRQMQRKLEYAGAAVFMCRSIETVIDTLKLLGVPLRAKVAA